MGHPIFKLMDTKKIVLFVVVLVLLAVFLWPRGDYKIVDVESGNVVVLDNGTTVRLIGITDTNEAKEYLIDHYKYESVEVVLIPDNSNAYNPNDLNGDETIYAYVVQKNDAQCINSTLLRTGLAGIDEHTYLNDSLKAYRKYAEMAKSRYSN